MEHEDTYTVAVPIASLDTVYAKITAAMGVEITDVDKENANAVYNRTRSGGDTFSGSYERGGDRSIELDASAFVNLAEKTIRIW